jgi:hypothetical protein
MVVVSIVFMRTTTVYGLKTKRYKATVVLRSLMPPYVFIVLFFSRFGSVFKIVYVLSFRLNTQPNIEETIRLIIYIGCNLWKA